MHKWSSYYGLTRRQRAWLPSTGTRDRLVVLAMFSRVYGVTSHVALLYLTSLASGAEVSTNISALTTVYTPYSSPNNVTFLCEVVGSAMFTPLWELSGLQIRTSNPSEGYIIEDSPDALSSTLTVTEQGREFIGLEVISVECHAHHTSQFRLVKGQQILYIVQFDAPGPVVGLELTYHSETELRLQWSRPEGLLPNIPTSYSVLINNTAQDDDIQRYETTETYVSVNQSMEGPCEPHAFTVTAVNDAGHSPPATLVESIPISLNITPVSLSQRVDGLLLTATSASITLSFQPATNCSAIFPVVNHTVEVEGLEGEVVVEGPVAALVTVTLTPADIPQLTQDQMYSIIITACTDLTCRTPTQPLVIVTTDTQTASAVFFSTAVSLNCSFAAGSSGSGCLFVFHLTNEGLSENLTVSYDMLAGDGSLYNTSCGQLTNTRGAYDDVVLVYDIEADGSTGSNPITASVSVIEDPDNFTCPLPADAVSSSDGLNAGEIAGIVLGSVVLVIIVSLVIVVSLLLVMRHDRQHRKPVKYSKSKGSDTTDGPGAEMGAVRGDGSGRNAGVSSRQNQGGVEFRPAADEYECVGHVCVNGRGKVDHHTMLQDILSQYQDSKELRLFVIKK